MNVSGRMIRNPQVLTDSVVRAVIPAGNEAGVGAELLDLFLHLFVEAGDERGNQHDHTDAEDHTEDRQAAAHFVRAKCVHSLF